MTDRGSTAKKPPQVDSRADLFFFLQAMAQDTQARASAAKSSFESSVTNEQVEEYVRRNWTV